jgi:DNA polymerase (family 10)
MAMDNRKISEILDEIGILLELKGDNPFKIRAYHNAAQVVSALPENISSLVNSGRLTSVKGIGRGLSDVITELVRNGISVQHSALKSAFPPGILDLLRIQGLGPKRIRLLYEKLQIGSIEELKKQCEEKRLRSIQGFGERTEKNILENITFLESSSKKHLYSEALDTAEEIIKIISETIGIGKCTYAGSLLRRKELIGDIDILAVAADKARADIISKFTQLEMRTSIIATGDTKASILLKNGMQCDLRIVNEKEFPFALNYFTGSKEHNVALRSIARKKGWSLNEYGFTKIKEPVNSKHKKSSPVCRNEKDIYKALGLHFIPPEIRENTGEVEYAAKHPMPELIEYRDIRGTFHCHTTDSDGFSTLEQFVEKAVDLGWTYLGISDHSKGAIYAGGLPEKKMMEQIRKIDRLNEKKEKFRIFKGTECEIMPDGSLDYDDGFLREFDYVVASIHSRFNMTESEATKRIIKALKRKYVTVLGHPTGRLLLEREGYPLDMKAVIDAASDYGKAIEINSHPTRLDMDWRFVRYAKLKKVPIFINPDAHRVDGLNFVKYGIGIARKGWLEKGDVVNTRSLPQIIKFLERMKGG